MYCSTFLKVIFIKLSFQNHQNRVRVLQACWLESSFSQGRLGHRDHQLHLQILDSQATILRKSAITSAANWRGRTFASRGTRQWTWKTEKVCCSPSRLRTCSKSLLHGQPKRETSTLLRQVERANSGEAAQLVGGRERHAEPEIHEVREQA